MPAKPGSMMNARQLMPRKLSSIAPGWWDYTTLGADLIDEAARLTPGDLARLSRPGFIVVL